MNNKGKELISEFNKFVDSSIEKEEFDFDKALEYLIKFSKMGLLKSQKFRIVVSISNFYRASQKENASNSLSNVNLLNEADSFLDELIGFIKTSHKEILVEFRTFLTFG